VKASSETAFYLLEVLRVLMPVIGIAFILVALIRDRPGSDGADKGLFARPKGWEIATKGLSLPSKAWFALDKGWLEAPLAWLASNKG
jgi:hypothetical protein